MTKKKVTSKQKTIGLSYAIIKSVAKKHNKKTRTLKGKIVVLNSKGKIYAHCREREYGIAWRSPTRKRRFSTGLDTKRITTKTELENLIKSIN